MHHQQLVVGFCIEHDVQACLKAGAFQRPSPAGVAADIPLICCLLQKAIPLLLHLLPSHTTLSAFRVDWTGRHTLPDTKNGSKLRTRKFTCICYRRMRAHRRTGASSSALWREGVPTSSCHVASNRSSAT